MEADVFSKFKLVAQGKLDTIALVASNHQRLNPLILNPIDHASRIAMAFNFPSCCILGLFFPNFLDVLREGHTYTQDNNPTIDLR